MIHQFSEIRLVGRIDVDHRHDETGEGISNWMSYASDQHQSILSDFILSRAAAMANADFDAGRLQRVLKKAIGAIAILIGQGCSLRIESAARQVVLAVSFAKRSNRLRHWGQSIHDSPRDSADVA